MRNFQIVPRNRFKVVSRYTFEIVFEVQSSDIVQCTIQFKIVSRFKFIIVSLQGAISRSFQGASLR